MFNFQRQVITRIEIAAPPGEVWRHLTDFPAYAQWNPFISSIEGELKPGSRLEVTMNQQGGKKMVLRPIVKTVEHGRKLVWLGRTFLPRLLDTEHSFEIEDKRDGTSCLIQSEIFSGFFAPYLPRALGEQTTLGFEMLNEVLKERVENAAAQGKRKPESPYSSIRG